MQLRKKYISFLFLLCCLFPAFSFAQTDTSITTLRKYNGILINADRCMNAKDYVHAKTFYKDALAIKPNESYPKNQIAACDYNTAVNSPFAKDPYWPQFMQQADSLYAAKDYDAALQWYIVANNFGAVKNVDMLKKMTSTKEVIDSIDYERRYPAVEYWPNGKLKAERTNRNVRGTFYFKGYSEKGFLEQEGQVTNWKKEGTWKTYYENGKVSSESIFSKDIITSVKRWDQNGKIMKR